LKKVFYLSLFWFVLLTFSDVAAQDVIADGLPGCLRIIDRQARNCDPIGGTFFFNTLSTGEFKAQKSTGINCTCASGYGDNQAFFLFEPIDISSYTNVSITMDFDAEDGGASEYEDNSPTTPLFACSPTASVNNAHDQMVFMYSINGGPFQIGLYRHGLTQTNFQGNWTQNGLNGTTLQIKVIASNKSSDEIFYFSNLLIRGTPKTISAGPDKATCSRNPITLSGSGTGTWTSSGAGLFSDANSPVSTYTPAANEVGSTTTVTFSGKPGTALCKAGYPAPNDEAELTINPSPTLTLSLDGPNSICVNDCSAFSLNINNGNPLYKAGIRVSNGSSTQNFNLTGLNDGEVINVCFLNQSFGAVRYNAGNKTIEIPSTEAGKTYTFTSQSIEDSGLCTNTSNSSITIKMGGGGTPNSISQPLQACNDGTGNGEYNLDAIAPLIKGSTPGEVLFFTDVNLNDGVFSPYYGKATKLYAVIEGTDGCRSKSVEIPLILQPGAVPIAVALSCPNCAVCDNTLDPGIQVAVKITLPDNDFYTLEFDRSDGVVVPPLMAKGPLDSLVLNISKDVTLDLISIKKQSSCPYFPSNAIRYYLEYKGGVNLGILPPINSCSPVTLLPVSNINGSGQAKYYDGRNGTGMLFNPGDIITSSKKLYAYLSNGTCADDKELEINITGNATYPPLKDTIVCDSFLLPKIISGLDTIKNAKYYTGVKGTNVEYTQEKYLKKGSYTLYPYDKTRPDACQNNPAYKITVNTTPSIIVADTIRDCVAKTLPTIGGSSNGTKSYYQDKNYTILLANNTTINSSRTVYAKAQDGKCSSIDSTKFIIAPTTYDLVTSNPVCDFLKLPSIKGTNISSTAAYYTQPLGQGTKFNVGDTIRQITSLHLYDAVNPQCATNSPTFTVIINRRPNIIVKDEIACDSFILPAIVTNPNVGAKNYYLSPTFTGTSLAPGAKISKTDTLYVYAGTSNCEDRDTQIITIRSGTVYNKISDTTSCESFVLPTINGTNLGLAASYYTATNGKGTRFRPNDTLRNDIQLFVFDTTLSCSQNPTSFKITIQKKPNILANDTSVCTGYTLPAIRLQNANGTASYLKNKNDNSSIVPLGNAVTTNSKLYLKAGTASCFTIDSQTITILPQTKTNAIPSVKACNSYTLLPIQGQNLSATVAYYEQKGGQGKSYAPGDAINSSTKLFTYDPLVICADSFVSFNIDITPGPSLSSIADISVCDAQIILKPITGQNLTGAQAYYTMSGGKGRKYLPGESISTSTNLFAFDSILTCKVEQPFELTVERSTSLGTPINIAQCQGSVEKTNLFTSLNGTQNKTGIWRSLGSNAPAVQDSFVTNTATLLPGSYKFEYATQGKVCPIQKTETTMEVVIKKPFATLYLPDCGHDDLKKYELDKLVADSSKVNSKLLVPSQNLIIPNNRIILSNMLQNGITDIQYIYSRKSTLNINLSCNDTTLISINKQTDINAGKDIQSTICEGNNYDLKSALIDHKSIGTFIDLQNTGKLSNSILNTSGLKEGKYNFYHVVKGSTTCPSDTASISVNIVKSVTAGPDIAKIYCSSNVSIINLDTLISPSFRGGKFSFNGVGATLANSIFKPIVDNAAFEIKYKTGGGSCPEDEASITINLSPQASAGKDTSFNICHGEVIDLKKYLTANTFNSTFVDPKSTGSLSTNASLNSTILTPNNTYTFLHVANHSSNVCLADESLINIKIGKPNSAGPDLEETVCKFNNTINLDSLIKPAYKGGSFEFLGSQGSLINTIFKPTASFGSPPFKYTIKGDGICPPDEANLILHYSTKPTVKLVVDSIVCSGQSFRAGIEGEFIPEVNFIFQNDVQFNAGNQTNFIKTINVTGGDGTFYSWLTEGLAQGQYHLVVSYLSKGKCKYTDALSKKIAIKSSPTRDVKASICEGEKYIIYNNEFNISKPSGAVLIPSNNNVGCDSTINVSLSFKKNSMLNYTFSTCNKDYKFIAFKDTFDTKRPMGTIRGLKTNKAGCDSTITVNLSFTNPTSSLSASAAPCAEDFGNIIIEKTSLTGKITASIAGQKFNIDSFPYNISYKPGIPEVILANDQGCSTNHKINVGVEKAPSVSIIKDSKNNINILKIISNKPIDDLKWTPANLLSCNDCDMPTVLSAGNVTLTYKYTELCTGQIEYLIEEDTIHEVYFPNIILFNSIKNGTFYPQKPTNFDARLTYLIILDRWGNKVFHKTNMTIGDVNEGWDGQFNGTPVTPGVYTYVAEVEDHKGKRTITKGDITVIR
jgi:hypothetical protein